MGISMMKSFIVFPIIVLGIIFHGKICDSMPKWNTITSEEDAIRNNFITDFARALQAPVNRSLLPVPMPLVTPFVLRKGTLHCHPNVDYDLTPRIHIFINMIRATLDSSPDKQSRRGQWPLGLPLMLFHGDGNGCDVIKRSDDFKYPRLSWHMPAAKYGDDWCNVISIHTYANWESFRGMAQSKWDAKIKSNKHKYTWSFKINRAVWRGSTTYPRFFGGSETELNKIPRGKLVQLSMKHPELIDAAFVNIIQHYKGREEELRNQTIIAPSRMPFDEQMKYKAIIDIDGNSWSSRFASLLCTNSVVIKIDPDHIESFYAELKPTEHYIPASLENITQVIEYVLEEKNDEKMRQVVNAANLWCKNSMNGAEMKREMMVRLEDYDTEFLAYMTSNGIDDVSSVAKLLPLNDFVECA